MSIRTDLAVECIDFSAESNPIGVERRVDFLNGHKVYSISVSGNAKIGKPQGEYITLDSTDFKSPSYDFESEVTTVCAVLKSLIQKDAKKFLVVGLGNCDITPDSLGPAAIKYIFVTAHMPEKLKKSLNMSNLKAVSAIAPGVLGQTGIESLDIIKSIAKSFSPDCILVIDALAAKSVNRLITTIQLSDAGIAPGSGVKNSRKVLNRETLGIPVISIGVPTVVDMSTIAHDIFGLEDKKITSHGEELFVTPREIDLAIEHAAKTVAFAINKTIHQDLSLNELISLVG